MHAVIMAGGVGTRFWPASRARRPKQLLRIAGPVSMLRSTYARLLPLVPPERILVVTRAEQETGVRAELPELPPANVLVEPTGRNTSACIGLAAAVLQARGAGQDTMLVLPADHAIAHEDAFRDALAAADRLLQERDVLLTLGVAPRRPETGYGYLQVGDSVAHVGAQEFHRVRRFVEKPNLATAQVLCADGAHLWNSGMFLWRVERIASELERHLPQLVPGLARVRAAVGTAAWQGELEQAYAGFPSISIDYAVMEKAADVWVTAIDVGWNDVGSWASLAEVRTQDEAGNVLPADALAVDSRRNLVEGGGRPVVLVGVEDLIVVDADDALLVCHRDRAQDVGQIPEQLRRRGQGSLT